MPSKADAAKPKAPAPAATEPADASKKAAPTGSKKAAATRKKPAEKKAAAKKAPTQQRSTTAAAQKKKSSATPKATETPAAAKKAAKKSAKKPAAKPARKSAKKAATAKKPTTKASQVKALADTKASSSHRELDLVIYGATGFTGRLVAEYLASHAPETVRIGLAGRSQNKLAQIQREIGGRAAKWPLIVADSSQPSTLQALAEQTTTIVTTVGPYAKYGLPLVAACAAAGTNYADLAGEVLFMRDSMDQYDSVAKKSGAKIVHSCGFDSIPSDMGVLALHLAAKADDGVGHLGRTEFVIRRLSGSFSGGTLASGIHEMERVKADPAAKIIAADPYSLSPNPSQEPRTDADAELRGADFDSTLDTFVGPFVMAAVNSRVVRRSNALSDWAYGKDFHYRETFGTGKGLRGRLRALALASGSAGAMFVMATPAARSLAQRFLPDPGEGPDAETRENGSFEIDFHTTSGNGATYRGRVSAKGDPGYAATSVMLSQTGLALAGAKSALPKSSGVLTPATGLGPEMIDRLNQAGITITARQV